MRFKGQGVNKTISIIMALAIWCAPTAAFATASDTEAKSAAKAPVPLKSEFGLAKQKRLAVVNQNNFTKNEKAVSTLRKKPSRGSADDNDGDSDKAPPTLKRKPGSEPDND